MATTKVEMNVMDLPKVKELVHAFNERCGELQNERDRYLEDLKYALIDNQILKERVRELEKTIRDYGI